MTTPITRHRHFVDDHGRLTQWGWTIVHALWKATGGAFEISSDELLTLTVGPSSPPREALSPEVGENVDPVPQALLNGLTIHQVFGSLKEMRSVVATLDFPSISTQSSEELTVSVTGAREGDGVIIGPPATVAADLSFFGYVSADDTVTVRAVNATTGAIDPASDDYRVVVLRFFGEII